MLLGKGVRSRRMVIRQSNQPANQVEAGGAEQLALSLEELQAGMDSSPQQSQSETEAMQPSHPLAQLKSKSLRWLLVGLSICCTLSSIAVLAFLWLTALPPVTNCEKISPLSPDMERLYCAQEAARSDKLPELMTGLKLVEQWPPDHPLYGEAQRWMADWSKSVLVIAQEKVIQSDLKSAVALVRQIPKSSPVYQEAQTAIAKWQKQWHKSEAISVEAKTAIKQQKWDLAYDRIAVLRESDYAYWRSRQADALSQQILTEKQARRSLAQAERMAQLGSPEQLGAAIALVSQIDTRTYTRTEAQPALNKWSESLLKLAYQHWQNKNLDQAITLAKQASLNPKRSEEAQNLLRLSQARKLAIASGSTWEATPKQVWNLMEAVSAAHQIKSNSRFYAQAQASLKNWEAQLQDVTQLQFAQVSASLGQQDALQTAIAQAQQVALHQPRRSQAQTLVAHWTHEIERLEDQPVLVQARKLAEPGTVSAFRAAIAQAHQIPIGRVLRGEAQGLVYDWSRRIEVLQDQPFLNLARAQASQTKLQAAIRTAAVIRPGRALYAQAQAAIQDWQAEIWRMAHPQTLGRLSIAVSKPSEEENDQQVKIPQLSQDAFAPPEAAARAVQATQPSQSVPLSINSLPINELFQPHEPGLVPHQPHGSTVPEWIEPPPSPSSRSSRPSSAPLATRSPINATPAPTANSSSPNDTLPSAAVPQAAPSASSTAPAPQLPSAPSAPEASGTDNQVLQSPEASPPASEPLPVIEQSP
jgi:hypothetical protein